jgi:hypothetical protein
MLALSRDQKDKLREAQSEGRDLPDAHRRQLQLAPLSEADQVNDDEDSVVSQLTSRTRNGANGVHVLKPLVRNISKRGGPHHDSTGRDDASTSTVGNLLLSTSSRSGKVKVGLRPRVLKPIA